MKKPTYSSKEYQDNWEKIFSEDAKEIQKKKEQEELRKKELQLEKDQKH